MDTDFIDWNYDEDSQLPYPAKIDTINQLLDRLSHLLLYTIHSTDKEIDKKKLIQQESRIYGQLESMIYKLS